MLHLNVTIYFIPKLFHKADLIGFMKLNKTKLIETLRRLNKGKTVYQARKVAGISVRRVYQIKLSLGNNKRILRKLVYITNKIKYFFKYT